MQDSPTPGPWWPTLTELTMASGAALGLTESQVDDLFRQAARISA